MNCKFHVFFIRAIALLTVCLSVNTFAQESQHIDDVAFVGNPFDENLLYVDNPFNDDALVALHEAMPDLPSGIDGLLKRIKRIEYHFKVPPDSRCPFPALCNDLQLDNPTYKVSMVLYIDLSYVEQAFSSALIEQAENGCSDKNFTNMRRLSLTDVQATYYADFSAHRRFCGNFPWGGSWSIDIASATGYITTTLNLKLTQPELGIVNGAKGTTDVQMSEPSVAITNTNLLGFINPQSVVGQVLLETLKIVGAPLDIVTLGLIKLNMSEIDNFVNLSRFGIAVPFELSSLLNLFSSSKAFLDKYEREYARRYRQWYLDTDQTKFTYLAQQTESPLEEKPALEGFFLTLSNFILVPEIGSDLYYQGKVNEMNVLRTLGKNPGTYTTQEGDSLRKISREKYGIAAYSYVLSSSNQGVSPKKKLDVGMPLIIPTHWEIFTKYGNRMLKPYESFRTYWKNNCSHISWKEFRKGIPSGYSFLDFILQREKSHRIRIVPTCP